MSRKPVGDKRTRVVDAAAKLVHEQGYHRTTLADISNESAVPLGNLSYYFKTKDAIGEAVVDRLACAYDALRESWESSPDPRKRLASFIQMTTDNRDALSRSGCPVGTLCAELSKDSGPVAERATRVLDELLRWIETQFRLLGKGRSESADLAHHLLSSIQGVSLLAFVFHDANLVARESRYLQRWIRELTV